MRGGFDLASPQKLWYLRQMAVRCDSGTLPDQKFQAACISEPMCNSRSLSRSK